MDLFSRITELRRQHTRAALVTVVDTRGSTPRKPGARMLLTEAGPEGTIGGGVVEHQVLEVAARVMRSETAELVHYELTQQLAMCCGGQMTFFVEPLVSDPSLIIFGCGHVGRALIEAAAPLGFEIIAVDDLPENADPIHLPQASSIVQSYEPEDLENLPFGDDSYAVIATRQHAIDQRLIEFCLAKPLGYLGVIGSNRKAHMQRERLAAKGFSEETVALVTCPIGADIGALTPAEIAIAICAQLIEVRRGGKATEPPAP